MYSEGSRDRFLDPIVLVNSPAKKNPIKVGRLAPCRNLDMALSDWETLSGFIYVTLFKNGCCTSLRFIQTDRNRSPVEPSTCGSEFHVDKVLSSRKQRPIIIKNLRFSFKG